MKPEPNIEENQVWLYDGVMYRVILIQRGKVKLIRLEGEMTFRFLDELELLHYGILKDVPLFEQT